MKYRLAIGLALGAMVTVFLAAARAADADHDSRELRPVEEWAFRLVVCGRPVIKRGEDNCARVNSYPGGAISGPVHLDLDTVAYGSFTAANSDQAMVTYIGLEPHANNWGGSILFERQDGRWRLLRWFPGTLTNKCVALPGTPQALLCLAGWSGQGEVDTSVWLIRVLKHGKIQETAVLKAQDDTYTSGAESGENYQCTLPRKRTEGILFEIDALKRSHKPNTLAEAKISYLPPDAVNRACRTHRLNKVRKLQAVMSFHFDGSRVLPDVPVDFAKTDY